MSSRTHLTRRSFLKLAGLTAGAAWASSRAHGLVAPSERVAMGFIGVGSMGGGNLGSFINQPGVQAVALCDVDERHLAEKARAVNSFYGETGEGVALYRDFRELLARDDIDAVMIATPDQWHALIAIEAMKSGKDVYCEKPMGLTLADQRAMVDAAERYGRVFQLGTQTRGHVGVRHTVELLRNGIIGRIERVEIGAPQGAYVPLAPPMPVPDHFDYDLWLGPAPEAPYTESRCHVNFRGMWDYSGGSVTDLGTHYVDIAQWATGRQLTGPTKITGKANFYENALSDVAKEFDFTCTFADGLEYHVSTDYPHGCKFFGSEGWIYQPQGYPAPNTCPFGTETIASDPRLLREELGADAERIVPGWMHDTPNFGANHHNNFLDCVRSRGVTNSPAEVGHRSTSIPHLGNIAMRLGRTVRWDPEAEVFIDDDSANAMRSRAMRGPWRLS